MSNQIVQERPPNRIWISRDFDRYSYRRYENGELVAIDEKINQARAEEVIAANPKGYTVGCDPVDFEPGAKQFTYEIPTTYQLRHPELPDAPVVTAEFRGYWRKDGRVIGLVLQFIGEPFRRHLTHAEIEEMQEENGHER